MVKYNIKRERRKKCIFKRMLKQSTKLSELDILS